MLLLRNAERKKKWTRQSSSKAYLERGPATTDCRVVLIESTAPSADDVAQCARLAAAAVFAAYNVQPDPVTRKTGVLYGHVTYSTSVLANKRQRLGFGLLYTDF